MFELHEARSHRLDELDFFEAKGRDITASQKKRRKKKSKKNEYQVKDSMMRLNFFQKMMTGGIGGSGSLRTLEAKDDLDFGDSGNDSDNSLSGSQRLVQLTELVKRPSKDLPDIKPRARRPRNRSVSDGVAAMRIFSNTSASAAEALKSEEVPQSATALVSLRVPPAKLGAIDDVKARPRPRRQKAISTGVFMMQSEKTAPLVDEGGADDGKKLRKTIEDLNKESRADLRLPPRPPNPLDTLGNCLFPKQELPQGFDEMPKSLQQKKFISPITEEEDGEEQDNEDSDDEDSVVSFVSEGVPDIIDFDLVEEAKQKIGIGERLRGLYVKKSYRQASGVFGTMLLFFMVAIRIELILLDTCAINGKDNECSMF
jgi:hypothetical protein